MPLSSKSGDSVVWLQRFDDLGKKWNSGEPCQRQSRVEFTSLSDGAGSAVKRNRQYHRVDWEQETPRVFSRNDRIAGTTPNDRPDRPGEQEYVGPAMSSGMM
jgi:hypothetical protein